MAMPSFLLDGHLDFFRVIVGLAMLAAFVRQPSSRQSPVRFWVGMAVLLVIAGLGLRPWLSHRALDNWVSYGSVFQAIFNTAVALLLIVRYYMYMPDRAKPEAA